MRLVLSAGNCKFPTSCKKTFHIYYIKDLLLKVLAPLYDLNHKVPKNAQVPEICPKEYKIYKSEIVEKRVLYRVQHIADEKMQVYFQHINL